MSMMAPATLNPREPNMWALDLDGHNPPRPVLAHRIANVERFGQPGEVRVTECGRRLTSGNHPRGWWTTYSGHLPLQPPYVHCGAADVGAQPYAEVTDRTTGPEPEFGTLALTKYRTVFECELPGPRALFVVTEEEWSPSRDLRTIKALTVIDPGA